MQVYSQVRHVAATRAIVGSAALFSIVLALAGGMSYWRSQVALNAREHPPDWGWSFQPPRRYKAERDGLGETFAGARRYVGLSSTGIPARLILWHIEDVESPGSEVVAGTLLDEFRLLLGVPSAASADDTTIASIGNRPAVQRKDDAIGIVVRATELSPGTYCAASLYVLNGGLAPADLEIFAAVCKSVQFGAAD